MRNAVLTKGSTIHIVVDREVYQFDSSVSKRIEESESIWFEEDKDIMTAVIRIEKEIVPYFKRRQLFPRQEIIQDNEDGSVILKKSTSNSQSLIHKILYWIPNIQVLEPEEFKNEIVNLVKEYIKLL